tara:strand:+ start:824 stop:1081 length:258 start_codon:yes stop_codon:yes gene_type:complete
MTSFQIPEPRIPPVAIDRIRPDFLHNKPRFNNLVTSAGGNTIYISGLVASTADGELVSVGDLGAQMAYIFDARSLSSACSWSTAP